MEFAPLPAARIVLKGGARFSMRKLRLPQVHFRQLRVLFVSTVVLVSVTGCGKPAPPFLKDLVPVTGVVTLDGKPLDNATVTFMASEGVSRFSAATTDADGRYELKTEGSYTGALPGKYSVTVSKLVLPDGTLPPPDVAPMDVGAKEMVPDRYSGVTEVTLGADVPTGGGTFDFALESKAVPGKVRR